MKRSLLIITGVAVAVVAVAIYFFYDQMIAVVFKCGLQTGYIPRIRKII